MSSASLGIRLKMLITLLLFTCIISAGLFYLANHAKFSDFEFFGDSKRVSLNYLEEMSIALDDYHAKCGKFPLMLETLEKAGEGCQAFKRIPIPSSPFHCDPLFESTGSRYSLKSLGKDCKIGGTGKNADIEVNSDSNTQ
jgi:hypothetical protein